MKSCIFSLMSVMALTFLSVSCSSEKGGGAAAEAGPVAVVPKPNSITAGSGAFTLKNGTAIGYGEGLDEYASYLQNVLHRSTDLKIGLSKSAGSGDIRLAIDTAECNVPEGYSLKVASSGVKISAHDKGGIWYGIQTLLQLFPSEIYSESEVDGVDWCAPAVEIDDAPAQPYRGMLLDVARYFHSVEFVKKYIDMMSMYKLNELQLHLVDDSGWRIEIKKYPRLTEQGAWAGNEPYRLGGFYSQEEMKDIIEYAAFRNVDIIPEIEFPAHLMSAVVAYPWLSCKGEQLELQTQHFISPDIICVGNPDAIQFLKDVVSEVADLFPSKYFNIGGDEAVYTRWEECPKCQALMKKEGLTDVSQLQGYLTNVMADFLKQKGKTAVGWDEFIRRGKVNNPVVALFWHNPSDTTVLGGTPHKGILVCNTYNYFDFPECDTPGEVQAADWRPPITIEKTYSLDVRDYADNSAIIGVEGCLWSDQFIHGTNLQEIKPLNENRSEYYVEYLTFPRLLALSEIGWTEKANRNFDDFSSRLYYQYAKLDAKGCNYRVPVPVIESVENVSDGKVKVTLKSTIEGAQIHYRTDGLYPDHHSPLYTEPIVIGSLDSLRAANFMSDTHFSLPTFVKPEQE